MVNETKSLTVIKALDSGRFAVRLKLPTGHISRGRLNFDQVVAILEEVFVFNDDSELRKYDDFWDSIKEMKRI